MSKTESEHVSELLSAARGALESELSLEEVSDGSLEDVSEADSLDQTNLYDHATEAREYIESEDPQSILEAMGLSELPDGREPSSIPEMIVLAPEAAVRELNALMTLSRLADRIESVDGSEDDLVDLEEMLFDLEENLQPVADDGSESGDATAETESDDGSKSALESVPGIDGSLEEFRNDLESLGDRLAAIREENGESNGDDTDDEERGGENDHDEEIEGEDDDGLLSVGDQDSRGDDTETDEPTNRSTTHSTMPSSNRADMTAVSRHSTMPDRDR